MKASVLTAIRAASTELNQAQEHFVEDAIDHAATTSGHAAAASAAIVSRQQQTPWGHFPLMRKLVDEADKGIGEWRFCTALNSICDLQHGVK